MRKRPSRLQRVGRPKRSIRFKGFIHNRPKHGQNRDCTVRAIATLTGRSYLEIQEVFAEFGRRRNCGFRLTQWLQEFNGIAFGHKFTKVVQPTEFGSYLFKGKGHVWAVVNGIQYDTAPHNMWVTRCWAVEPTTQRVDDPRLRRAELLAGI